jgi:Isochorismatase family
MASRFRAVAGRYCRQGTLGVQCFANTDLDMLLKQHRIAKVIVIGLLANTCIETTGRFAMELGYHVTLVKDATAAFNKDRVHAGDELNGQHTRTRFFLRSKCLRRSRRGDTTPQPHPPVSPLILLTGYCRSLRNSD